MTPEIHLVEPEVGGTMHHVFNAALLHTAVEAYSDHQVVFHALPVHADQIRELLHDLAPEVIDRVRWEPFAVPPSGEKKSATNLKHFRHLLKYEKVLLTSVSRSQILLLKLLLPLNPKANVRAVLHGDIDRLLKPQVEPFPKSLFSMHAIFRKKMPANLRFLILGQSILDHVPAEFKPGFANCGVIHLPYHFPAIKDIQGDPKSFGVFGNCGDGIELEKFAKGLRQADPEASVRLIGFVRDDSVAESLSPYVEFAASKPISRPEFTDRAEHVRYVAWMAPKGGYRMRASATFFDALLFLRPILYTDNVYINQYFDQEPLIGRRCVDTDDLVRQAADVSLSVDDEAYREMQAAILKFRERFTPVALAPVLREQAQL